MRRLFLVLVLVAATICFVSSPSFAADKGERAQMIFDQSCSTCHVFGKKPGDDPREKFVLDPTQPKWTDAWVRRWLDAPDKVNPKTMCLGDRIDPVAKDLLVSFLRVKNTPGSRLETHRRPGGGKIIQRSVKSNRGVK